MKTIGKAENNGKTLKGLSKKKLQDFNFRKWDNFDVEADELKKDMGDFPTSTIIKMLWKNKLKSINGTGQN